MVLGLVLPLAPSAQAEVILTGPDGPVETREPVDIGVEGITNEDLVHTTVLFHPEKDVRIRPIMLWGSGELEPVIEFYTKIKGSYKVSVVAPADNARGYDVAHVYIQVGDEDEDDEDEDEDEDDGDDDQDDEDEDDGDDEDDDIEPGHRKVIILEETGDRSPTEMIVMQELGKYLTGKKHEWRIRDKDAKDSDIDRVPDWVMELRNLIAELQIDYPVIIVSKPSEDGDFQVIGLEEMPQSADKAIEVVKSYGG
jgi:hypothetical protein